MSAIEVSGVSVADLLRTRSRSPPSGQEIQLNLGHLEKILERHDPSPDQIADALDTSMDVIDAAMLRQRTLLCAGVT